MKKIIALLLICAFAVFAFAACGSSGCEDCGAEDTELEEYNGKDLCASCIAKAIVNDAVDALS